MTLAAETSRVAKVHAPAQLTVSPSGDIRSASAAAHRLLGYADGSLVGLSLAWLAPPSRHEVLAKLEVALDRSTPICAETMFMREDGEMLHVDLTLRACGGGSGASGGLRWKSRTTLLPCCGSRAGACHASVKSSPSRRRRRRISARTADHVRAAALVAPNAHGLLFARGAGARACAGSGGVAGSRGDARPRGRYPELFGTSRRSQ